MLPPDPSERTEIPMSWVGYDEVPVAYANQFLLQYQLEGSFVMGVGEATPPALVGSPDEIAAQVAQLEFVPVRTLARVALTEAKVGELIAVLQASLAKAKQLRALVDPRGE